MSWLLLRAELRKQLGLSFLRSMVAVLLLGGAAVVLAVLAVDLWGPIRTRQLLGWPATLSFWAEMASGVLGFLPAAAAAWSVGLEQSHDTWKTVLTRRTPRRSVIFAKALVGPAWLLTFLVASLVLWGGLGLLGELRAPIDGPVPPVRADVLELCASLINAVCWMPMVMLVALLARTNGTLVGTLFGIIAPFALHLTQLWQWLALNRATPVLNAETLVARMSGEPSGLERVDALVGPGWGVAQSACLLGLWLVVPLAVAVWHFERRDIVSEVA